MDDNRGRTAPYPDGTMWITDCHRAIDLELDMATDEQLENTLRKLDTIISVAKQAKKDAVKINKRYKKEKKKHNKRKK